MDEVGKVWMGRVVGTDSRVGSGRVGDSAVPVDVGCARWDVMADGIDLGSDYCTVLYYSNAGSRLLAAEWI